MASPKQNLKDQINAATDLTVQWASFTQYWFNDGSVAKLRDLRDKLIEKHMDTTIVCHIYHDYGDRNQPNLYFGPLDPSWYGLIGGTPPTFVSAANPSQ